MDKIGIIDIQASPEPDISLEKYIFCVLFQK